MKTLPTRMQSSALPHPCSPMFATTDAHGLGSATTPVTNRWLGGIRAEVLDSGTCGTKRIAPGRLAGGLT
jgi:hypothetical protein